MTKEQVKEKISNAETPEELEEIFNSAEVRHNSELMMFCRIKAKDFFN